MSMYSQNLISLFLSCVRWEIIGLKPKCIYPTLKRKVGPLVLERLNTCEAVSLVGAPSWSSFETV